MQPIVLRFAQCLSQQKRTSPSCLNLRSIYGSAAGSPSPVTGQFAVGDKVRVTLAEDVLKPMQKEHGGWNPKMSSVS